MNNFTNKYSLSKTLRFELKPVGETAKSIELYKSTILKDIVKEDEERSKDYKIIKKYMDEYHRFFIEKTLTNDVLLDTDVSTLFNSFQEYTNDKKNQDNKDQYKKIQTELKNKIANNFKSIYDNPDKSKEIPLFTKDLIEKDILLKYFENNQTSSDINELKEILPKFKKFTTYFIGFNENRKNIYSENHSSIAHRIINDNSEKFFSNCIKFKNIASKYPDLYKQLEECIKDDKNMFKEVYFKNYLSQSNIDKYNSVIGAKSETNRTQGINETINLYRQQNDLSTKDIPNMFQLYKQILSESEDTFSIETIDTVQELFSLIKNFFESLKIQDYQTKISELFKEYNLDVLYIREDSLTNISKNIFGSWDTIKLALEKHSETLTKTQEKDFLKQEAYQIKDIQKAIDLFLTENDNENKYKNQIKEYFCDMDICKNINNQYKDIQILLNSVSLGEEKEKESNISKIKELLDLTLDLSHFLQPFYLYKFKNGSKEKIEINTDNTDFYDKFDILYLQIEPIYTVVNKTRNFITKKPYSIDKFKINFGQTTLLSGWDISKERDNLSIILFKDNKYYLGIINKENNDIFSYVIDDDDSSDVITKKNELKNNIVSDDNLNAYQKMIYKLLPDPSKMLPKVFFSEKQKSIFKPSDEIKKIRDNKLYIKSAKDKKSMSLWIDFMKESIKKHTEWNKYFKFNFSKTEDYADVSEFYKEVQEQGYSLYFDNIKESYIDEKIKSKELFLFEIYNKDFSQYSKGKPNLHTSYWKLLFSEDNLKNTVIKLNGQAELFFRRQSLEQHITHPKNSAIQNKTNDKQSIHKIDLIKDKRFTEDKFFFHCPITLNFGYKKAIPSTFNKNVNEYLSKNNVNILGIDRGERNLLYYTLIDSKGKIIDNKQGSLNEIENSYTNIKVDYHDLLDKKEKERDEERKSWKTITTIKDLKSGYLSNIVHKIAKLMIENNAVLILEDLNFGFKRGRFAIEKQIYQNFEKAIINKLNYLVFKDKKISEPGHYLKAYQLTAPFESFEKLGKQSGFLFYVPAYHTSKIDPTTGFVNMLYPKYANQNDAKNFISKFDNIRFNNDKDYFEFSFDYENFRLEKEDISKHSSWTICSYGKERYRYDAKNKEYQKKDITEELKNIFVSNNIDYENSKDLRNDIQKFDTKWLKSIMFCLSVLLQIRYSTKEKDFILSPVANDKGMFFDSRLANNDMPKDADANGAYHIALKGLLMLEEIRANGKPKPIKNKEWFDYVQNRKN